MDVIAVHAAGFSYAGATLGTAITPEQARLMSRYTKEVIIAYDTDEAGQKAAEKALRLFDEVGLACRVLDMQGAKDPDEYIQKFGVEQFKTLLTQSQTKFEFNYHKVISKFNLRDPQQKIEAVALLCQQIASTYSASEQDIYIRECAERLTVDADSLRKDVARLVRKNQRQDMQKDKERRHVSFSGATDRTNKDFSKSPQAARAEEAILGILQLRPEVRSLCFASPPLLEEKDFFTTLGQRIFAFIANGEITGGVDLAMADAFFTTDEVSRMTKMRVDRMRLSENGIDAFKECILRMKQAKQEYTIENQDISIGELGDYLEAMRKKKEEEKE